MQMINIDTLSTELVQNIFCDAIGIIDNQINVAKSLLSKCAKTSEKNLVEYSNEIVELSVTEANLKSAYRHMNPIWESFKEICVFYDSDEEVFGNYTTEDLSDIQKCAQKTLNKLEKRITEEKQAMQELANKFQEKASLPSPRHPEKTIQKPAPVSDVFPQNQPVGLELVKIHLDDLPEITNSANDLFYFINELDKIVSKFRGLNVGIVEPCVKKKIPREAYEWIYKGRLKKGSSWTVSMLCDLLVEYAQTQRESERKFEWCRNRRNSPFNGSDENDGRTSPQLISPIFDICVFCNSDDHPTSQCPQVNTIKKMRDRLAKDKRCYACLMKGHNASECYLNCRICKRAHHWIICESPQGNLQQ